MSERRRVTSRRRRRRQKQDVRTLAGTRRQDVCMNKTSGRRQERDVKTTKVRKRLLPYQVVVRVTSRSPGRGLFSTKRCAGLSYLVVYRTTDRSLVSRVSVRRTHLFESRQLEVELKYIWISRSWSQPIGYRRKTLSGKQGRKEGRSGIVERYRYTNKRHTVRDKRSVTTGMKR